MVEGRRTAFYNKDHYGVQFSSSDEEDEDDGEEPDFFSQLEYPDKKVEIQTIEGLMAQGEDITDLKVYLHDMVRFISSGDDKADEQNMLLLVDNIHYKAVIAWTQACQEEERISQENAEDELEASSDYMAIGEISRDITERTNQYEKSHSSTSMDMHEKGENI